MNILDSIRIVDSGVVAQTLAESELRYSVGMQDGVTVHAGTRDGHEVLIVEVAGPGALGLVMSITGFSE